MLKRWLRLAPLLCRSRNSLLEELTAQLSIGEYRYYPTASGRVAIHQIAREVRQRSTSSVAFIPDYICNVVPLALERAGWTVHTYPIDDWFEPHEEDLRRIIRENRQPLLLVSSIYGSSASLDLLRRNDMRELVLAHGAHVLVDICQDITRIHQLPAGYQGHLSAVVSFNDKSFPGLMGGGILSSKPVAFPQPPPSWYQVLRLYRCWMTKSWASLRRRLRRGRTRYQVDPTAVEFSQCRRHPHAFDAVQLTKMQIGLALLGLRTLNVYYQRRERSVRRLPQIRPVRNWQCSPYLIIDSPHGSIPRRIKPPYGRHRTPQCSARPGLLVIHNKGFDDE